MPYITQKKRDRLEPLIVKFKDLMRQEEISDGELNYLITRICIYFGRWGGKSYTRLNMVAGVLTCVFAEYNRREVAPYEDKKKKDNGDVYQNGGEKNNG